MKKMNSFKMYKSIVIAFVIVFGVFFNNYGQVSEKQDNVNAIEKEINFEADYQKFLENQKKPLLTAHSETFVLDGIVWERLFEEKEYCLTPTTLDVSEYRKRIKKLDDPQNGIIKSKFHFLNVEITPLSKSFLSTMNIQVPDYVQGDVNVYLPVIDIDVLSENGINFIFLESYGQNEGEIINTNSTKSIIWSEDWEGSLSPYTMGTDVSKDCTWGNVYNCKYTSSSWSLWVGDDGSDCYANCTEYPNNMGAYVYKTTPIPVSSSCYTDIRFYYKLWCWIGNSDELERWNWTNTGGWSLAATIDGNSIWCDKGWHNLYGSISGSFTYYGFKFYFDSNSFTDHEEGIYLDDMELTGTPTTPPSTDYGNWSSCSNCSQSRTVTTYSWSATSPCYTSNTTIQTQACNTPPATTAWSSCSNNIQTRTVYTCTGNGTWSSTTEYQCCGSLPATEYGSWSACNNCSKSRSVTTYSWGTYPNCVISNTTTETQGCSTPPSPTSWSTCSDNQQSRTVYTCTGDGTWSNTTEYQCCGSVPATEYDSWSAWNNCSRSRQVTTYSLGTYPNCVISNTTTETETGENPTITTNTTDESGTGNCDGTATVNVNGGVSPYTYVWSNSCSTTNSCDNLCSGEYTVTVTDANGCNSLETITIITGIEDIDFINYLSIYPNPTSNKFTIEMAITKPKAMELKLFNLTGQILLEENIKLKTGTYTKTIDMSNYVKGVYTLQLISDEGTINRKIVVE